MKVLMQGIFKLVETMCAFVAVIEPAGIAECGLLTVVMVEAAAIAVGMIAHRFAWEEGGR